MTTQDNKGVFTDRLVLTIEIFGAARETQGLRDLLRDYWGVTEADKEAFKDAMLREFQLSVARLGVDVVFEAPSGDEGEPGEPFAWNGEIIEVAMRELP